MLSCANTVSRIVQDRVSPSAVFLATVNNTIVCFDVVGTTQYQDEGSLPVSSDSIYDIASITKVIAATGLLMLIDLGEARFEDPVSYYLPTARYDQSLTLFHLLTHTAGIQIQMSKIIKSQSPEAIHQAILNASTNKIGEEVMFTNANSYLIGKIIEKITSQSLEKFFGREIFAPLEMDNTTYKPSEKQLPKVVPTEISTERGLVKGTTHDPSAYALGGIVGHSGLFSTALDMANFCQMWLQGGCFNGKQLLSTKMVNRATKKQIPASLTPDTGFGWMLNREFMGILKSKSYGHTGFTGTSISITPDLSLACVLLTNRVYPNPKPLNRHTYNADIINDLYHQLES